VSPLIGGIITTEHKNIKRGSSFFYNFECARRIIVPREKTINFFFGLIANAVYRKPDRINGIQD